MEPWKRTMPTIVLLLLGSISTNVQADITKTPTSGVFLEGSDVTLNCVVEGNDNVIWEDFREATEIFFGKDKNTEKKKYDNFEISSGDEDFSLIIKDVHLSDEGTYICKDRDQHPNATVTIGVLPYVYLSVKQSEATQASQTSTEVNITCSAYNARPALSVFELSVIGSEKMVNITNDKSNQNEDEKNYNSSASVSYIMSSEEMSVYCRVFTAGRSIKHTENFYKTRCNITMSGNEIRCLCQANPQVKSYYMDVNGNNHDGDVLFIEEDDPMNIRCFATNELGTGQSDLLFPDDIYGFSLVPIAVIVSVVALLVVLTVIYIRHRLGPRDKKPDAFPHVDEMKHVTITAVVFLLAITQGSAEFQCPSATFVELGKSVLIDCLISDVNDIYWLRGTEEDHYPIVKIEMGLKTISKIAQDHFDITDSGALVIRDASNDLTGSYVMLHYRTNHVKEVDTVTLNVTKLIDSIITEGPSGGVYPMGSTITLSCTFQKGYVVGWKEYENIDIFVADTKVTDDAKYDNFRVSLSDGISSLLIIGADLEDAGDYSCNTKSYAHVEIEAPPSLRIMFNVTDDERNNSTESHGVIDITCIAKNARPAVIIRFKTDGSEWINPSGTWTVSNGVTFDTYATLKYSFQKNQTDVLLTCQTFGQTSVSAMEKTIHLYLPICNITISGNEVRCTCQANPPVDKYRMELDGNLQDGDVLYIKESNSANVTCFGTNGMGTGLSSLLFPGNKAVLSEAGFGIFSIVVTISVAVVLSITCCLAVVCIKRRCSSRGEQSDEEQPTVHCANEEESVNLLPQYDSSLPRIDLTGELTDPQKCISKILFQVNKDWEIFAIEVLNTSEKVVEEAVMENDNFADQINAVTENMTSSHIKVIYKNATFCTKFGVEFVKDENGCFLQHTYNTQTETSHEQDPTNISSRVDMLKLCRERIGRVGIRRLLSALTKGDIETEDETNVLKKLDKDGVININCTNLISNLSDCKLFRARKIVFAYLEADLWNYITNHLCPQISLDWEIFAVEVLKLENDHVLDIIEHTNDEKGQILSMFRKWRSIRGQQEKVSKPFLQDLIEDNELSGKIMSKDNRPKDVTALKVKPTNEGNCSKAFLEMLTTCSKRIGVVGSKRLEEINFQGGLRKFLVGVLGTSAEAPEGISVDDSVDSLGQLCLMLSKANLFTARDVVKTYIEKKLH